MLRPHYCRDILYAQEICTVVNPGDKVEILLLKLGERTGTDDARIVYKQIDPAETLDRCCNHIGYAVLVGNIDLDRERAFSEIVGNLAREIVVEIRDHDRGTFSVDRLGDAFSESLRTSRDDRSL